MEEGFVCDMVLLALALMLMLLSIQTKRTYSLALDNRYGADKECISLQKVRGKQRGHTVLLLAIISSKVLLRRVIREGLPCPKTPPNITLYLSM